MRGDLFINWKPLPVERRRVVNIEIGPDSSGKSVPSRAIIVRSVQPARNASAAGPLFASSPIRRRPLRHDASFLLYPACASESAPPSELFRNQRPARAKAAAQERVSSRSPRAASPSWLLGHGLPRGEAQPGSAQATTLPGLVSGEPMDFTRRPWVPGFPQAPAPDDQDWLMQLLAPRRGR